MQWNKIKVLIASPCPYPLTHWWDTKYQLTRFKVLLFPLFSYAQKIITFNYISAYLCICNTFIPKVLKYFYSFLIKFISMSSLEKCLLECFAHFLNQVNCIFLVIELHKFLKYFVFLTLDQIYGFQIFSPIQ